jgi:hypothetical protein
MGVPEIYPAVPPQRGSAHVYIDPLTIRTKILHLGETGDHHRDAQVKTPKRNWRNHLQALSLNRDP